MKYEYIIPAVILIFVIAVTVIISVLVKKNKKKRAKKKSEEEKLIAAIACAISVYTEKPTSDFRVVSFKKINRNKAWNLR